MFGKKNKTNKKKQTNNFQQESEIRVFPLEGEIGIALNIGGLSAYQWTQIHPSPSAASVEHHLHP